MKDKILSFFKGAATDYADVPKLSRAAKRYYNTYKKLFDEFSARNQQNNAIEPLNNKYGSYDNKNDVSDNVRTTNDEKAQVSERKYASNIDLSDADLDEYMKVGKTKHTRDKKQRMLDNGKKPILTSKSEASEFIIKAIKGEALGEVKAYQKIGDRLASAISAKRNSLDLYGKYLEINADDLREAYKNHKEPKEKGDIALSDEEFANIPEYIDTFDGITSVDEYNGKVKAYLYKKSENGYYRILTVVSNERSSLQVTKMIGVSKEKFETKFQNKKERDTGSPRGQDASIPSTKARHTAGALSDNSIPQATQKSNTSTKKSSEKSTGERYALPEGEVITDDDARRVAAIEKFGTTREIYRAGFLLPDGRMLNMSRGYGFKGVNHNAIEAVFESEKGELAINKFIQEGNIRLKAEAPGIEIGESVAPDPGQVLSLRKFINSCLAENDDFYLDITAKDGKEIASVTYYADYSGVNDIIYDIERYYEKRRIPVSDTGVRYALPVGDETVNARTVSEEDVRTLLGNAYKKQYKDGSYIPVRVNTPSILIESAQSLGKTIDDLPVILNVGKARQMMSTQREWVLEQKRGTAHDFSVDDVIALVKAMDRPKYIVYQTVDERYVEVVEFDTAEKQKAVAVLEIGENKNPEYLNGYNGGFYQVLVTAFEPDTGYVETLLNKNSNIKIYPKKKKGSSQRGSGNRVPSHLNESPFAISISQKSKFDNTFDKNSSKKSSDRRFALPEGEDIDALLDEMASDKDSTLDMAAIVSKIPVSVGRTSMTVGELKAVIANNTKQKIYSKKEALSVVNRFSGISELTKKSREERIRQICLCYLCVFTLKCFFFALKV